MYILGQVAVATWLYAFARAGLSRSHSASPGASGTATASPHRAVTLVRERQPVGVLGALGPYLVLAACALPLLLFFETLPQQIPLHYGASGLADRVGRRTFQVVLLPSTVGLVMVALIDLLRLGLRRLARPATGGEARRNERVTAEIFVLLRYFLALVFGMLGGLPLLTPGARQLVLLATLVLSGPGMLVAIALVLGRHNGPQVPGGGAILRRA